ncbi:hypothetical protein JMJ35_004448 [Cladonia borealis]|uniref:PHD-type domain-containing protein n=1 Tax=Cladonia borealis TaxID=184061 RepID=A0AA39V2L8_9LECA|nr:hypothetical protein JMJ35_004448 [Cladonia borealis]
MGSTTEDSDWNMSPNSRRQNALSNSDSGQSSPQPSHLGQSHTEDADPSLSTPHPSGFDGPAEQRHYRQGQNVAKSIIMPKHPRPPIPVNADTSENGGLQDTPEWGAARDAVLSQMITSQDIGAASTPPSTIKVNRGGVKTGGRRGRGGRRPKVKIEGEDNITAEIAAAAGVKTDNTPVRGKNKGGRPRGSRARISTRGGIIRPELSVQGTPVPVMKNKGGRPRGSKTVNRGGRPRGSRAANSAAGVLGHITKKKRKRGTDDEDEPDDTSASEEFTPLAITSSGRRINPTQTYSPLLVEATSTAQRLSNNTPTSAPHPPSTQRPKKRRKPGEAAVCINCGRGHSPNSNQIVFCDGCNTPWHQFCHNRPITPTVIQFEEKEWLCSDCEIAREEKSHISGKIAAVPTMTPAEKRTYFRSLGQNELVSLLLHASTLHPDLPIFRPPVPVIVEPQPTRPLPTNHHITMQVGDEEEVEVYEYIEPEPLPYPKAGNGIVLPSEEEDLSLLIDEDIVTYSHLWKGPHGWEGPKGMRFPWPEGPLGGGAGGGGMGGGRVAIGVGA